MSEEEEFSGRIAIIGMDGRFPGAKNLKEYWENLLSGEDSTRELSEEELLAAGESRETIVSLGKRSARLTTSDVVHF